MSDQRWRYPNAYKHGAFSRTAIVPGEDLDEFEELYSDLIEDVSAVGVLEEHAVLTIARAMWRQRRAQKFIQIEVLLNSSNPDHPGYNEYESLAAFVSSLRAVPDDFDHFANRLLDAELVKYLNVKFPLSKYKSSQERADAVIKEIESVRMPKANLTSDPRAEDVRLMRSSRTFTADFFDKELRLDERLDTMIDRAVKRLLQMKAAKQMQMFGQTRTERPDHRVKKIAVKKVDKR
jgi:hypothetical protein